ncbi:MAG: hypothetical protein WD068_03225 [Candidatus Babeliales bacterium]
MIKKIFYSLFVIPLLLHASPDTKALMVSGLTTLTCSGSSALLYYNNHRCKHAYNKLCSFFIPNNPTVAKLSLVTLFSGLVAYTSYKIAKQYLTNKRNTNSGPAVYLSVKDESDEDFIQKIQSQPGYWLEPGRISPANNPLNEHAQWQCWDCKQWQGEIEWSSCDNDYCNKNGQNICPNCEPANGRCTSCSWHLNF